MARRFPRARVGLVAILVGASPLAPAVRVLPHPVAPRVDVLIDARPFATYLYLTAMTRPALVSLRAADSTAITDDDDGGDSDRPVGFWFAHGNVNGVDFTDVRPRTPGTRIVHRRLVEAVSSDTQGRLAVQTAWTSIDGSVLLLDDTYLTFSGTDRERVVDRVTRLAAVNGPVPLGPTTRPQVGVQLADGFREREALSGIGEGNASPCRDSRGRWAAMPGVRDGREFTVALFDHQANLGYPNVLRCRAGALELAPAGDARIEAGASLTFRYRLVIVSGRLDATQIEERYRDFLR